MSRGLRGARPRLTQAEVWRRQIEKTLHMLEVLKKTSTVHGTKWNDGMNGYYKGQVERMLSQIPRGCQSEARAFRSRLRKL